MRWSPMPASAFHEIHLTGNSRVPTETILAALGMKPGESIFSADLPAARARILALDWIASADVVRRYPDAIFVNVVEKRPFALVAIARDEGASRWWNARGGVITTQGVEKFARLPKLVGAGAPRSRRRSGGCGDGPSRRLRPRRGL